MKTKLLLTSALFILNATFLIFNCHAAVLTLSNAPQGGAQYATLLNAYNAASNGDTILIEGTGVIYSMSSSWSKKLTLVGIGYNPNKVNPLRASINIVSTGNNRVDLTTAGNGSAFYGVEFVGPVIALTAILNYSFDDCLFDSYFSFFGSIAGSISFRNCVFTYDNNDNIVLSPSGTANTNILVTNCEFDGYINGSNSTSASLIVDHCLFLATGITPILNLQNALVQNSMFMNYVAVASATTIGCTFNNNLSKTTVTLPPAGNTGAANLINVDPLFVSYVLGSTYSASQNYHLQSGSPAIGLANDGTDIGIHGGTSHFSETGEVLINPIIRSLNVINSSVAPNGNLNVNINATKPTDN